MDLTWWAIYENQFFDNALKNKVDEIYVNNIEQKRWTKRRLDWFYLKQLGLCLLWVINEELVYVRDFTEKIDW